VVPAVFVRLPQFTLLVMYGELDGTFPNHPADPLQPANQRDRQAGVTAGGLDIGLAFDGDADRVFVVDEQGGFTGLVSLEDLVEEVVGEIFHEKEAESEPIHAENDGAGIIDGRAAVRDAVAKDVVDPVLQDVRPRGVELGLRRSVEGTRGEEAIGRFPDDVLRGPGAGFLGAGADPGAEDLPVHPHDDVAELGELLEAGPKPRDPVPGEAGADDGIVVHPPPDARIARELLLSGGPPGPRTRTGAGRPCKPVARASRSNVRLRGASSSSPNRSAG